MGEKQLKKIKLLAWVLISWFFVSVPSFVFAAHGTIENPHIIEITNPLDGIGSLDQFVTTALRVVRDLGFLVAIFFLVYAGYLFVTARGNETKLTTAKNAFLWAIVGTAVIIGAELFARAIEGTITNIGG